MRYLLALAASLLLASPAFAPAAANSTVTTPPLTSAGQPSFEGNHSLPNIMRAGRVGEERRSAQ